MVKVPELQDYDGDNSVASVASYARPYVCTTKDTIVASARILSTREMHVRFNFFFSIHYC